MFDQRDAEFWHTEAEPALGVPVHTAKGIIFVSECRFCFDEYNVDFVQTAVESTLAAPVMLDDGSVRCVREIYCSSAKECLK